MVCLIENPIVENKKPSGVSIEAQNLISTGKRHFICGEVQDAIDAFSQACQLLADKYGQTHDMLASPYLYYGKALLEMARIENGVLGHAVQDGSALGETEETDEVEKEEKKCEKSATIQIEEEPISKEKCMEIRKDVEHAMREGNLYNDEMTEDEATEDEGDEESKQVDKVEKSTETKDKEVVIDEKEKKDEKEVSQENEEDVDMEQDVKDVKETTDHKKSSFKPSVSEEFDDEEVSTMQLAWEVLELSYTIFKRIGTEACMRQAECKHLLGQVSMEKENYLQAVTDFIEAHQLQTKVLEQGDRRIAEACYSVGLAYSFDKKFPESITWYKKSVEALESRISHLNQKLKQRAAEEFGEDEKSEQYTSIQKEVDELKDLVVLDMKAKMEDVEISQKQYNSSIHAMRSMGKEVFTSGSKFEAGFEPAEKSIDNSLRMANDITDKVIRMKRKSVNKENEIEESEITKKQKSATEVTITAVM